MGALRHRDRIQIIVEILSLAINGASKTQLVYKANLNFKIINNLLPYLVQKGLIESGAKYKTTDKGREFLENYKRALEALK